MNPTSQPIIAQFEIPNFPANSASLDTQSALLIENIRHTLTIHAEMFRRILEATPSPSLMLAEMLEDAGNRYIDFSELVCSASLRPPKD